MKESIGSTASLNIVFAFVAIVFAFLAGALSYYRAYKINNAITNSLEKYEGYNFLSIDEISKKLESYGYQRFHFDCPNEKTFSGKSFELISDNDANVGYCIYHYSGPNNYDEYGITTYMTINLPLISNFVRIPINSITHEIYRCYGNVC